MIKKQGNQFVLYTKDGSKVLGKHGTRDDAVAQEMAINISKAREAGHFIPKPPKKSK
jgi:hypothetical protein